MKIWTEQMILDLIDRADNAVLFKMLHSLYERQTAHEQSSEYTRDRNDVGFSAYDAKFLTSVAKNAEQYKRVSNGQAPHIRKAMKKYRKQLVEIANANEQQRKGAPVRSDFAKADEDTRDKQPWGGRFVAAVDKEIDAVSSVVTQVMTRCARCGNAAHTTEQHDEERKRFEGIRTEALQGDLYSKSWDEVFKTEDVCDECQKNQSIYKDGCCVYCEECYEDFLERRKEDELEDD